ncbi:MAG: DMT family transporter [Methanosarcina sp.]|jgi:small multidrug resistance pump
MNSYYLLLLAIVFEVSGTTCMKLSLGFSRLLPSILIFVFYGICFFFFTLALKGIDVSIAYAIWAGLGTALITVVGIF